jgi:hypothetical protein
MDLETASYPMGTGGDFPGLKRPRHEADHSHPTIAEVKGDGAIRPLSHTLSWHNAQGQFYLY